MRSQRKKRPNVYKSTEEQEQSTLVQWMTLNDLFFYHIRNGGKLLYREGGKFKRLGVIAGACDLCIPMPTKRYHGLYIEVKTIDGKLINPQKKFIEKLRQNGYCAEACYGWEDGVKIIQEYFS